MTQSEQLQLDELIYDTFLEQLRNGRFDLLHSHEVTLFIASYCYLGEDARDDAKKPSNL